MTRGQDILLDQHMVVAERRRRLALARGERVSEVGGRIDLAHPLAAAARDGLDQHRIADLGCLFRSEEHTSELQSLMRISYAVLCLKKKNNNERKQAQE